MYYIIYMMNINNMFDFSNKSIRVNNTVMCIYELAFYITIVAINGDNLTYNYYSDEWLYLINYNYPNAGFYNFFVEKYNHLIREIHSNDVVYYDKHVVSLLTTFCRGSVHGYSGFWYSIITYINNIENYDELDIIMYKDCDAGMLSIVNHLCNVGVIIKPIIFLEKNVKYKFSSIARICEKAKCCLGPMLSPNQPSLVTLIIKSGWLFLSIISDQN